MHILYKNYYYYYYYEDFIVDVNVLIFVTSRSECNQTQLVFLSPSVNNSGTINKITITIDGTTRQLETTYRYVSNPMITSVTPVSAYKR